MIGALLRIGDAYDKGRLSQVEALREVRRLRPDLSETAAVQVLADPYVAVRR